MIEKMKDLISRIPSYENLDETATKQVIILPLLSYLGWDIFNPHEVKPEYSVSGGKVDYALRIHNVSKVFIEVKRVGIELEKHQKQLLDYSFAEGVRLAVLTNGLTFWLYLPLMEGTWDQRRFYTIDILQQDSDDIIEKFIDFLSFKNVANGKAVLKAEELHRGKQRDKIIQKNMPKAWNKMVSQPDELLIDLLSEATEKICGQKPDVDEVSVFLKSYEGQLKIPGFVLPTPSYATTPSIDISESPTGDLTGKRPKSFTFEKIRYDINKWRELLIKLSEIIQKKHPTEFKKCLEITGGKRKRTGEIRPYFSKNPHELDLGEQVSGTDIYVETKLAANVIFGLCLKILEKFGYDRNQFSVETL